MVSLCLEHGADINMTNNQGMAPLTLATCQKHYAVVELLLAHPLVQPDRQDVTGRTALHWACALGATSCASVLSRASPKTAFVEANNGSNPFQLAVAVSPTFARVLEQFATPKSKGIQHCLSYTSSFEFI